MTAQSPHWDCGLIIIANAEGVFTATGDTPGVLPVATKCPWQLQRSQDDVLIVGICRLFEVVVLLLLG